MDHIVRCMLDVDANAYGNDSQQQQHVAYSYIETNAYPEHHQQQQQQQQQQRQEMQCRQDKQQQQTKQATTPAEDKPYAWRMQPKAEPKYQLFPKKPATLAIAPTSTPCSSASTASGISIPPPLPADKPDRAPTGSLRLRMKEHSIIRRRKVSVPDIGPPMTTVQEISMDSPTIPGRPPLHERSTSAPGTSMKKHHLVDCMIQPTYEDIPEQSVYLSYEDLVSSPIELPRCSSAQAVLSPTVSAMANPPSPDQPSLDAAFSARHPHSSTKALKPLVIPPLPSQQQQSHQPPPASVYAQSSRGHSHSYSHSGSTNSGNSHHHNNTPMSYLNVLRPSASATTPLYAQAQAQAQAQSSFSSRFRSGTAPSDGGCSGGSRSARSDASPHSRTPFTPLSAISAVSAMFTPSSAATTDTNYTMADFKESLASFGTSSGGAAAASTEPSAEPRSTTSASRVAPTPVSHRRDQSESGSIMERGRPRKRSASREGAVSPAISAMVAAGHSGNATAVSACQRKGSMDTSPHPTGVSSAAGTSGAAACGANASTPPSACASAAALASSAASLKSTSGCSKSSLMTATAAAAAERRAFEVLPRGYRASEAPTYLPSSDIAALTTQALQQASRFEVLCRKDVENLSRELRSLDERCEYLRRTYTSLRTGRRNLHGRICQYLRSPRVAKFSHESMLKQEEALAELDTSIDDWVLKLEKADNRRTRVRQKLLEHVAAAVTLPLTSAVAADAVKASAGCGFPADIGETLQLAMGLGGTSTSTSTMTSTSCGANKQQQQTIATPPRSPTKSSSSSSMTGYQVANSMSSPSTMTSPQRPAAAQVPSTILEQPLVEEAMAMIAKSEAEAAAAAAAAAASASSAAASSAAATAAAAESASKPASRHADKLSPISTSSSSSAVPSPSADADMSLLPSSPQSPISTYEGFSSRRRSDVESIRIYASDDVYTLLADVESQIAEMGTTPTIPFATPTSTSAPGAAKTATAAAADSFSVSQRRMGHHLHQHHRNHSNSGAKRCSPSPPASPSLCSGSGSSSGSASKSSSPTDDGGEIFLTSAVFHPERSMLVM